MVYIRSSRGWHSVRFVYSRTAQIVRQPENWKSVASIYDSSSCRLTWELDRDNLKVFVYQLPTRMNVDIQRDYWEYCQKTMMSAELHIHQQLMESPVRTLDPYAADYFFVPAYTSCKNLPEPFKGSDTW